jgi:phosphatidyl-myo-inositol dimannoside synthase
MTQSSGIRAILVTTDYPPEVGGLQTYAYRIAKELPQGLLKHVLVGRQRPGKELPQPQLGAGLTSHRGRGRLSAFLWSLWRIPYFRFRHGINFQLHMQWSTAIPSWVLSKLGSRSQYIVFIHGAELLDPKKPWLRPLKSTILKNAKAVVAGSRHTAEILAQQGIRCSRLEVIPYGNPLEGAPNLPIGPSSSFEPKKNGIPRLLCLHRLVPRKGTALLLSALAKLTEQPWTLEIVGTGEEESRLKALVVELKISQRVTFRPPVDSAQKTTLLSKANLFILPSLPPEDNNHFEGLGLTLLEAQSLGVPVLAARTGGIPEAIHEGRTGVLFRAGDVDDLTEKISQLLKNPEQRLALGQAGPEWVSSHFSWKLGLAQLAEIMLEPRKR